MASEEEILDFSPGVKHSDGWTQLIAGYLRDLTEEFDRIKLAVQEGDYAMVKACTHRIKGTSGTYGLDTISENVAQLGHLVDEPEQGKTLTKIEQIMQMIEDEIDRLDIEKTSATDKSERDANA